MSENALIGYTGVIGTVLRNSINTSQLFNRANILKITEQKFNDLYISAPTGNRLYANANALEDFKNVQSLFTALTRIKSVNRVILIGTVDSLLRPNSPYGKNRLWLEQQIRQHFQEAFTFRLGALVHQNIRKNVLYDLKYKKYLDCINNNAVVQWYNLNNLYSDIQKLTATGIKEHNLISEPIAHGEIISTFFPDVEVQTAEIINHTIAPYYCSKEQIFIAIRKYLND